LCVFRAPPFSIQLLLILMRFDIDFRFKTVFCAVVLLKKLKNVAYQDFFHWRASWFWRS
jgi:hypothetical protein